MRHNHGGNFSEAEFLKSMANYALRIIYKSPVYSLNAEYLRHVNLFCRLAPNVGATNRLSCEVSPLKITIVLINLIPRRLPGPT